MDILTLKASCAEVLECFGNLSKEGFSKGAMGDLLRQKQGTSKFTLASVLLRELMLEALCRELRRLEDRDRDTDDHAHDADDQRPRRRQRTRCRDDEVQDASEAS